MMMKSARLIPAAAALVAVVAFAGPQARADVIPFAFNGGGFSGSGFLTIMPNGTVADPNPACGTAGNNACRADPAGAYAITGISGTFSNAANSIVNAAITGLVPINPANERDLTFDPLVPSSLSFIDYGSGPSSGALTYNNLFFPDGSPIDCDYPFSGTFLDVFGMAFTVAGGYTGDLWGDGNIPGLGLTYGFSLTDGNTLLVTQGRGVNATVPEPATLALFGIGLLGLMLASRKRTTVL